MEETMRAWIIGCRLEGENINRAIQGGFQGF